MENKSNSSPLKITEDTCFEIFYYSKLFQLLNNSQDTKQLLNFMINSYSQSDQNDISNKYLILDAYHNAESTYQRLRQQLLLPKESNAEIVEQSQNHLVKFIDQLYKKKENESNNTNELQIDQLPQTISVKKEPVRIYIDGAFDLIHSGHYNAIRQAKSLGDILVMGVNSDAEILKNKGPCVLTCKERADILRSCKWIDEVYEDTEYTVTIDILDRYNCQYYAHGDDAIYDYQGVDICGVLKKEGRFKMFKRTEGVSTTDVVGKLLLLTKENSASARKRSGSLEKPLIAQDYVKELRRIEDEEKKLDLSGLQATNSQQNQSTHFMVPNSQFLATTRRILHFSNNREPKPTDRVVYISGSFDLLHNGHIEILKKAKAFGDFLYVGLWTDEVVNYYRGHNYPIVSLHERVLMVLANKYVDDVIIGAPFQITRDLIKSLNIAKVVQAKTKEDEVLEDRRSVDPNAIAKEMGVFEEFEIESDMTIETIAERVVLNREKYKAKYQKKKVAQDKYYQEEKQFVSEL